MPSADQLRSRLMKKLSELFRLDQPDLDFGFYRIMHAKAQEVQDFIGTDLLKIVEEAFGDVDEARKAELQKKIDDEIKAAKDYGVAEPENSPKVKEAQAMYEAVKDTASAEADVYDHLYRFFERYYDDGDFITRRYYTRETSGKAAPFAVPYNGEEVKLHWANADQYYIKSTEYFSNFTFDLTQSAEVRKMSQGQRQLLRIPNAPLKVHFRVVQATEGEHGNVKATEDKKRFFILYDAKPIELDDDPNAELVVNFEYRADPEKTGQENTWRDKRNAEAVAKVLTLLDSWAASLPDEYSSHSMHDYLRLLTLPAPTESDKKRPLLAKYVNQYTARNTMDYFIHKDLGGFLRRELDFYIKNEVMHLDDIENAEVPAVESYLAKIKVLRKIAGKLIDFLAQLEDFQKKLWLKKKFIVETNYCVTLDRVPEKLYPEVTANEAQCEEWIKLFSIDEIRGDLVTPGFSRPLTVDFLKANNKLVLDTRFFNDSFKARLVASIDNFDEQCDGLLIHSENFQALNLLQERYREQVKCVYIDPPYNTGKDDFIYKDGYRSSSWLSSLYDRVWSSFFVLSDDGIFLSSIADHEVDRMRLLLHEIFGRDNFLANFVWNNEGNIDNQSKVKVNHEYILSYCKNEKNYPHAKVIAPDIGPDSKLYNDTIENSITKNGPANPPSEVTLPAGFPASFEEGRVAPRDDEWPKLHDEVTVQDGKLMNPVRAYSGWSSRSLLDDFLANGCKSITDSKGLKTWFKITHTGAIYCYKERENQSHVLSIVKNVGTVKKMSGQLAAMGFSFSYPKPVDMLKYFCKFTNAPDAIVLDYYAGSGTTAHAVIGVNRSSKGLSQRRYILVETGDHFDTVLKPRIQKAVYSAEWKDGKPAARHTGISHCFKYIRLESYEDTLNNLRFDADTLDQAMAAHSSFKEDYMLRYLLDVETRGSQSLLNIDAFADPTAYTLNVKKPGTDECAARTVDLIETFNYLIGLRVQHTSVPQSFQATFKRFTDPELPEDQRTKLVVDGRIRQDEGGPWWFRKVEGWVPKDPANPNNGQQEKVLVVWRKLTGDIEQDNLILDEWFQKNRFSTHDFEFDTIYVNGSNNLPNLKLAGEEWKVRLIEEEFIKRMWNAEGI